MKITIMNPVRDEKTGGWRFEPEEIEVEELEKDHVVVRGFSPLSQIRRDRVGEELKKLGYRIFLRERSPQVRSRSGPTISTVEIDVHGVKGDKIEEYIPGWMERMEEVE